MAGAQSALLVPFRHVVSEFTIAKTALTPARQADTRLTYPRGMEGWVDLGDLLHTEMIYPPADSQPSK